MAKETKTLTVSPYEEQSTINTYLAFGWEVVSSQEIYDKNTYIWSKSNRIYSSTGTTNFIKIVFSRDKNIPNYEQLRNLECKYNNLNIPEPNLYKGIKKFSLVLIILDILFFLIGAICLSNSDAGLLVIIILSIVFFVLAIALLVGFSIKGKNNANQYYTDKLTAENKRLKIISQAKSLLN